MKRPIVVIGGGVVGASTAWHLLERGAENVTLIERDRVGSGTTWHSAGNITWKPGVDTDAPVAYMLDLVARLERETGQSTGWLTTGRLFLSRSEASMQAFTHFHDEARAAGVEGTLLDPADVPKHHPLIDPGALVGAWLNPRSGRLNPADLVAAYAKGIRARGGRVVENCTFEAPVVEGGRLRALLTSTGRIEADAAVVATGLWSRNLMAPHGVALAHGACEHFYAIADVTPRLPRETPSFICSERLIYGREETGGFLVGFFDRDAKVIDTSTLPEPFTFTLLEEDFDQIAAYYDEACALFPALTDAPIRRLVNGPESFTPDGRALVGPLPGVEGLYAACALNSGGVTYSGMVGHTVADLMFDTAPRFDGVDLDPGRFGENGADPGWIDARMPDAPSGAYLRHHRE